MMRSLRSALTVGVLVALPVSAKAQDFYNGFRGPKTVQIDLYASRAKDNTTGTIIPKAFLWNVLLAAPLSVSQDGVKAQGMNVGFIADPKHGLGAIVATGLFLDEQGKYKEVVPQAYATFEKGPWTLDAEARLPIHTENGIGSLHTGFTAGRQITDRLRVGASIATDGTGASVRAIARYELTKDHRYWAQVYGKRREIGARLAINVGRPGQ